MGIEAIHKFLSRRGRGLPDEACQRRSRPSVSRPGLDPFSTQDPGFPKRLEPFGSKCLCQVPLPAGSLPGLVEGHAARLRFAGSGEGWGRPMEELAAIGILTAVLFSAVCIRQFVNIYCIYIIQVLCRVHTAAQQRTERSDSMHITSLLDSGPILGPPAGPGSRGRPPGWSQVGSPFVK